MVNFHGPSTVPPKFKRRKFYPHNASVTLMRTTAEESAEIGADIGRKVATAQGPSVVLLPSRGVSAIDRAGQPFDDPAARQALFDGLAHSGRRSTESWNSIGTSTIAEFAEAAANKLIELMRQKDRSNDGIRNSNFLI